MHNVLQRVDLGKKRRAVLDFEVAFQVTIVAVSLDPLRIIHPLRAVLLDPFGDVAQRRHLVLAVIFQGLGRVGLTIGSVIRDRGQKTAQTLVHPKLTVGSDLWGLGIEGIQEVFRDPYIDISEVREQRRFISIRARTSLKQELPNDETHYYLNQTP
ncbi:hypothetical protein TRIP_B250009 [uncultured Desulfatiglans sp.]|uniref:Uncharacterized protein n=1 Tax=Uncultured Desulfatiglans sp. TaxID=1748965 RepID=A0A653A5E4_UNCDX|nr:hypothetical protein TRIP_B250009 [uncultured Desulfatiglans sp.]